MSEELETKLPGVTIYSTASSGEYRLREAREGVILRESDGKRATYSMDDYARIIKSIWRDYLDSNVEPSLMGLPITDAALVVETRHCIAPNSFYAPGGWRLPENREQLMHWLLSEKQRIKAKISEEAIGSLVADLEEINRLNLERKSN